MARTIPKISNPQVGIYTIRFRDNKGHFTKALSKAKYFHYTLKNGTLSRKIEIPKEIKKVGDRTKFIKITLSKIYSTRIKRAETIENRKKQEARDTGKAYKPKETLATEEAIGLSKKEREEFEKLGVRIIKPDYKYKISRSHLKERKRKVVQYLTQQGKITNNILIQIPPINASTEGTPTPLSGDTFLYEGRKIPNRENWVEHLTSIGLIGPNITDQSIMFVVVRYVREFMRKEFSKFRNKILKDNRRVKIISVTMVAATDIEEHDDFLVSDESINFEFNINDNLRKLSDSVSFKAAVCLLRLLNRDIEGTEVFEGALTSQDIATKIKLPSKEDSDKTSHNFIVFPYMMLEPKFAKNKNIGM